MIDMPETPAAPMESPCILVCAIEPETGHCYGCGRTRDEIAGWTTLSAEARSALMQDELPQRVAKLERRPRRVTKRNRMKSGTGRRRDTFDVSS